MKSNGNVGIGTISPSTKLHVIGDTIIEDTSAVLALKSTQAGSTSSIQFESLANAAIIGGGTADYLSFMTASNHRMRILANGNVGIGTTSPGQKLHVVGGGKIQGNLMIGSSGDVSGAVGQLHIKGPNAQVIILEDTDNANLVVRLSAEETVGFKIEDTTHSNVLFFGDQSGNVGVGTDSPDAKLDVNGGIRMADDTATASATNEGTLRYRKDANNSYIDMCMQTGASTYAWVNIKTNTW
jgi:hypothetical protein